MGTEPETSHPDSPDAMSHGEVAAGLGGTVTHSILLGEAHPDLRAIFTRLLRRAGHRVHTACDADTVIDTAGRTRPHLIIINLQELGAPTCRTLRATSVTATTPVILLSTTLRLDARTAAEAGANTYIALPVHLPALLRHVHTLLRKPDWYDLPACHAPARHPGREPRLAGVMTKHQP